MKRAQLLGYVIAGATIFAAGYGFGGAVDTINGLRKQPASMLTVGLVGANANLSKGTLTVESGRFVLTTATLAKGSTACPTELEALRLSTGVRTDKNGVKMRSHFSKYFLPAEEQGSNDAGVLARRDAIDDATTLRVNASGGSCEAPLMVK